MKRKLTLLSALLLLCCNLCFAQANSVRLYDGLGNLISIHSTIQDAYDAIPATLTQHYEIELNSAYNGGNELFPVTFINKAGADANNFIRIYLTTGITSLNVFYTGSNSSAFIFDNADWVYIDGTNLNGTVGLRINNQGGQMNFPTMQLINGACNNRLYNVVVTEGVFNMLLLPTILLGPSSGNISGNSNNTIEKCVLNYPTIGIQSEGSMNNPNKNNLFKGNSIHTRDISISLKQGTGKTIIDSNYLHFGMGFDTSLRCGLVAEDLSDSIIITKNRIRTYLTGAQVPFRGIYIKSTTGSNAYTFVANNFISFQTYDNHLGIYHDDKTDIAGIEYDGNYPVKADIYHNTIRVLEKLTDTILGPSLSACLKKTGSNSASIFNITNNIFSSERLGGTNAEHISLVLENTAGTININHNSYHSAVAQHIKYNSTLYTTLNSYQAAIGGGNEVNSNFAIAEFAGGNDFHLYGSSISNPLLLGTLLPGITDDFEGDIRTLPYRGCDEFEVNCTPDSNILTGTTTTVCIGDSFLLNVATSWLGNGNTWQWQSRPQGTTGAFIDIPGATHYTYIVVPTQSIELRVVRSCIDNSFIYYSDTLHITVNQLPSISGIAETHTNLLYDFSATNPQNVTQYLWDFGDGTAMDTATAPQHSYADTGTYTVTLIISNQCGSDTATFTVTVTNSTGIAGTELNNTILLYPNPAVKELKIRSTQYPAEETVIYNAVGAIIFTDNNVKKEITVDVSSLSTGSYIVRIKTEKGFAYKKLQVLRP